MYGKHSLMIGEGPGMYNRLKVSNTEEEEEEGEEHEETQASMNRRSPRLVCRKVFYK